MEKAILITLIICTTLIILSVINTIKEARIRKESKTIFDDIFKPKEGNKK